MVKRAAPRSRSPGPETASQREMADSVDRVFGHALNTVNKIRPGSNKPPLSDRQELYGLYKQSMEGDVVEVADRPTAASIAAGGGNGGNGTSSPPGNVGSSAAEQLKKEQAKWDAWKSNEGLTRTAAKRRYIEKLIDTMHRYASFTPEARELVEELEFVWDQIRSQSQRSSSERSSPLQQLERSAYLQGGAAPPPMMAGDAAGGAAQRRRDGEGLMRVLSPVSQAAAEEEELLLGEDEDEEEVREEFVDAPISQVDDHDMGRISQGEFGAGGDAYREGQRQSGGLRPVAAGTADKRWKKRVETSLMKLTTEVAALREQLEARRYFKLKNRNGILGWVLKLGWWAVQLVVADAVLLWLIILYLRRRKDHRLEIAVRVLLGDAVAQVQRVGGQVKMPTLSKIAGRKQT